MAGKKNSSTWTVVAEALRLDSSISDRAVAASLEIVSHSFVGIVRRAMVATGELPSVRKRIGVDRHTRHLPRTAEEKEQVRQENERVRQEKEQLWKEKEQLRQERDRQSQEWNQQGKEKRRQKMAEVKDSLKARPRYSNRYHAYKCRVAIGLVKSTRQAMIAKGELQDVTIPEKRSDIEKEVFRQEKERRLMKPRRLTRHEMDYARPTVESEEARRMEKEEEREFKKRLRNAGPLDRNFGRS